MTSVGSMLSTVIKGGGRGNELVLAVCREGLQDKGEGAVLNVRQVTLRGVNRNKVLNE